MRRSFERGTWPSRTVAHLDLVSMYISSSYHVLPRARVIKATTPVNYNLFSMRQVYLNGTATTTSRARPTFFLVTQLRAMHRLQAFSIPLPSHTGSFLTILNMSYVKAVRRPNTLYVLFERLSELTEQNTSPREDIKRSDTKERTNDFFAPSLEVRSLQ